MTIEPGDAVDIISDYFSWKRARDFDPDPTSAENYGHYLQIERELRILKAVRADINAVIDDTQEFDLEFMARLLDGEEVALRETEANYEA